MVAKGAEHDVLVHQGTHLMLDRVLKDLQVHGRGCHLLALHLTTNWIVTRPLTLTGPQNQH